MQRIVGYHYCELAVRNSQILVRNRVFIYFAICETLG